MPREDGTQKFQAAWTSAEDELKRACEWFMVQEFHYYNVLNNGDVPSLKGFQASSEILWGFITPLGRDDELEGNIKKLWERVRMYDRKSKHHLIKRLDNDTLELVRSIFHRIKETAQKQGWRVPAVRKYDLQALMKEDLIDTGE